MIASTPHDAYLESWVLTADPLELVRILYRLALDSVREALIHLSGGDIAARSKAISKAIDALSELNCSLDHEAGGEVARRLAELYEYMQWRLLQANFEQSETMLGEVAGLLATLLEAWQDVSVEGNPQPACPYSADMIRLAGQDGDVSGVNACA
jgi:flagellar protein FliS